MNTFSPMSSPRGRHPYHIDGHMSDWNEPAPPPRDWKKALLILGLGTLSWVATYVGMLELVQANMGELPWTHKIIIGFSVAMLMIMIIWLLDQLFAPLPVITKAAYIVGYVFLTVISVGFGFGFYWKVLESRSEATRSAESAVTQVKTGLYNASARLDQLQTTLDQLMQISQAKAVEERERGTSCPNSRPGDGPRRRLRDADAARFAFAAQFVKGRALQSKDQIQALDLEIKKITTSDPSTFDPQTGTRNKFLQDLTRRLQLTATGFNAFRSDPQLRQIRAELAERAVKTQFPTSRGGTFSCPDPQLQSALRGVVRAIDQLPELGLPQIATVEGAQAVIEAFRRLATTIYGILTFKLQPSSDELRAMQQRAVKSAEAEETAVSNSIQVGVGGLSKRDYIPLAIAMFVDLCLLLVSIGRPMNRLNGLIPKMREAERGPVYQILSRFDDIHRDSEVLQKFEVFRHVVFDFHGDYYVAVPLDAPRNITTQEQLTALQQEAHLLANLFASFEKEKIFSRVYNPMLTRSVIQKKLARQGSKFSDSQAFRIYRFRDGAWSEIILGAIMGAARAHPPKPQLEAASVVLPEQVERIFAATADADLRHQPSATINNRSMQDKTIAEAQQYQDVEEPPVTADLHKAEQQFGAYAQHWLKSGTLGGRDGNMHSQPESEPRNSEFRQEAHVDQGFGQLSREDETMSVAEPQPAMSDIGVAMPDRQQRPENAYQTESDIYPVFSEAQPHGTRNTAEHGDPTHDVLEKTIALHPDRNVLDRPAEPLTHPGTPFRDDVLQPVADFEAATPNYNVRITERTADFTLPGHEVPLPHQMLDVESNLGDGGNSVKEHGQPDQHYAQIEDAMELTDDGASQVLSEEPRQVQGLKSDTDRQTDNAATVATDDTQGDDELKQLVHRFAQTRTSEN